MPAVALVGIPGRRRLPPVPIPLIILWPLVPLCLAVAGLLRFGRPTEAAMLRTATLAFCQLRGLVVEVDTADRKQVRIRLA